LAAGVQVEIIVAVMAKVVVVPVVI